MPNFPVGQPRASRCGSQNAYVRFSCESTKLEPLRIRYFHIFDRGGNLFELAIGCRFRKDKTAVHFGGHESPQGVIDQFA